MMKSSVNLKSKEPFQEVTAVLSLTKLCKMMKQDRANSSGQMLCKTVYKSLKANFTHWV